MSAAPGSTPDGVQHVQIKVPADATYIAVLRTTTAVLAARLDFTLDEIEDLRIIVDEAASLLLADAADGVALDCEWRLARDELALDLSCQLVNGQRPGTDGFTWTVLTALADSVTRNEVDGRSRIEVSRRRSSGVAEDT